MQEMTCVLDSMLVIWDAPGISLEWFRNIEFLGILFIISNLSNFLGYISMEENLIMFFNYVL